MPFLEEAMHLPERVVAARNNRGGQVLHGGLRRRALPRFPPGFLIIDCAGWAGCAALLCIQALQALPKEALINTAARSTVHAATVAMQAVQDYRRWLCGLR